MKKQICLLIAICYLAINFGNSQEKIDGNIPFQSDPAKGYALYIPSGYNPDTPNPLMLGLHPLNTSRWDAVSWRDTLVNFAEANQLLLVCPDGGSDGRIDDPIDTSFTSAIIDSMEVWYNVDLDQKYMMGFSWGGKTCYSYGLRRTAEFNGYLVIGAAVNGAGEVSGIIDNAMGEAFYLLHGSADSPQVRYFPLLEALEDNGACVSSTLMPGVGHTIDFPDRNTLLTEAYQWLAEQNCGISSLDEQLLPDIQLFPNPSSGSFKLSGIPHDSKVTAVCLDGRKIPLRKDGNIFSINHDYKGLVLVRINYEAQEKIIKLMVN